MRLLPLLPFNKTVLLIRLMVGLVFLSEGLQKFLFPASRGAGRFEAIGLPWPEALGYGVGSLEVICGLLVVLGLWTRLATLPLLCVMAGAFLFTKLPTLLESGFWAAAHEARTDFCMTLGLLVLLLSGAGRFAVEPQGKTAESA